MYNKYTPTYLYVKYHKLTGLKYFGKTTQNPFTYLGSGTRWTRHIKKHGTEHVDTLWVQLFSDKNELINFATSFSVENNIVESSEWANLCIENGLDGGARVNNHVKRLNKEPRSAKWKSSQSSSKRGRLLSANAALACSKSVLIDGVVYPSLTAAGKAHNRTGATMAYWVKVGKAKLV
jgi:hypothetical protein